MEVQSVGQLLCRDYAEERTDNRDGTVATTFVRFFSAAAALFVLFGPRLTRSVSPTPSIQNNTTVGSRYD